MEHSRRGTYSMLLSEIPIVATWPRLLGLPHTNLWLCLHIMLSLGACLIVHPLIGTTVFRSESAMFLIHGHVQGFWVGIKCHWTLVNLVLMVLVILLEYFIGLCHMDEERWSLLSWQMVTSNTASCSLIIHQNQHTILSIPQKPTNSLSHTHPCTHDKELAPLKHRRSRMSV